MCHLSALVHSYHNKAIYIYMFLCSQMTDLCDLLTVVHSGFINMSHKPKEASKFLPHTAFNSKTFSKVNYTGKG